MQIICLVVKLWHLLFKVSSVLFIHQHQIKEIAYRELLVDVPHGGCQVISCKETEHSNFKGIHLIRGKLADTGDYKMSTGEKEISYLPETVWWGLILPLLELHP